jgi:hypothetical protein
MQSQQASSADEQMVAAISLADPDVSTEMLDELAIAVREELLDTEVESVSSATNGPAPDDSRALDATVVGELVVVLGSSATLLRSVLGVLKAWRERNRPRRVEVRIADERLVLSDATEAEQERLVDEFIHRVHRR